VIDSQSRLFVLPDHTPSSPCYNTSRRTSLSTTPSLTPLKCTTPNSHSLYLHSNLNVKAYMQRSWTTFIPVFLLELLAPSLAASAPHASAAPGTYYPSAISSNSSFNVLILHGYQARQTRCSTAPRESALIACNTVSHR
jgi:hypothetical protein